MKEEMNLISKLEDSELRDLRNWITMLLKQRKEHKQIIGYYAKGGVFKNV